MNLLRILVATLTIALLASVLAGCIGSDGEASMKSLYGAAKDRAKEWNADAVLVHAGTFESANVEKMMGDDEEHDDEAYDEADAADDEGGDAEAEAADVEEDSDDGPPFKLRNDPNAGNGRGTFWMFVFVDPETGDALQLAVEASGKVHALDEHDEGSDEWAEEFAGMPAMEWDLDSDTAASKAHANDDFHAAVKKIKDPVFFVGLGPNSEEFYEESEDDQSEDDGGDAEGNHTADLSHGVWVITGTGMSRSMDREAESGEGHDHDDMAAESGWLVAYAAIDAVTGRTIAAGAYDASDWMDDYDYDFGWGYGGDEMPQDFTAFYTQENGRVDRLRPSESRTIPVEMEGLDMRITFCSGRAYPGSATFEVVGPDGEVLHEPADDEGVLAVGGGGYEDWEVSALPAGDYEITIQISGGVTADWGMNVWVGAGEPGDESYIQGPFGGYGGC